MHRVKKWRFVVQGAMLVVVLGLLVMACGEDKTNTPLYYSYCNSGYTYCSGSGKCCPSDHPYHCNSGSASGTCYTSVPTNPPCTTYDYCSG